MFLQTSYWMSVSININTFNTSKVTYSFALEKVIRKNRKRQLKNKEIMAIFSPKITLKITFSPHETCISILALEGSG